MPKLDTYHAVVRTALAKDNWNITHDPMHLKVGLRKVYIDLGAEYLLSADKGTHKIAVEVKSFLGHSDVADLEQAVGQYVVYETILKKYDPERMLYLALSERAFNNIFSDEIGQLLLADKIMRLLVFNEESEVISQWIPH